MPKKDPYGQFCPMATMLDAVGDRWTLLIVRELFCGPLRFGEVRAGLNRVSSDVLTKRLKRLVESGVATHDADGYYELSPQGRLLKPVLHEMGKWGAMLWPHGYSDSLGAREIMTLLALGPTAFAPLPPATTELRTDSIHRWLTSSGQGIEISSRGTSQPDTTITLSDATLSSIVMGQRTWAEAEESGALVSTGQPTFLSDYADAMVPKLLELVAEAKLAVSL